MQRKRKVQTKVQLENARMPFVLSARAAIRMPSLAPPFATPVASVASVPLASSWVWPESGKEVVYS